MISLGISIFPGSLTRLESDADNLGGTDTSACLLWLSPSASILVHRGLRSRSLSRTEGPKKKAEFATSEGLIASRSHVLPSAGKCQVKESVDTVLDWYTNK